MKIRRATICEWQSVHCHSKEITDPTWEEIREAIEALDGESKNDLYLAPNPEDIETYLCVGGGSGRYVVTGSIGNERFPTVIRAGESSERKEKLVVGGQEGYYPQSWIVDLDTAVIAAKSFFDTGEFGGGGLAWEDV